MFRSLTFALSLLTALVPTAGSAAVVHPSEINLHNGYIEVRNEVVSTHWGAPMPTEANVFLQADGTINCCQEHARVDTGSVVYLNRCCIVAGTRYTVELHMAAHHWTTPVRPRLCNVRGIPFGYAVVVFTGTVNRSRTNEWSFNITPHVLDAPCPADMPR